MPDDLRSQLQAMARWADARHEPIDPEQVRVPTLHPADPVTPWPVRRRLLGVAAAVVVLVAISAAIVNARPGDDVIVGGTPAQQPEMPTDGALGTERSPSGWASGAPYVASPSEDLGIDANARLLWTGSDVLVLGGMTISGPVPPRTLVGDDGPIGTEPGATNSRSSRFGPSPAYDPVTGTWRVLPEPGSDIGMGPPAVWTGSELIVIGRPDGAGCYGLAGDSPPTTLSCGPEDRFAFALDPRAGTWRRLADPPWETERNLTLWTGDVAVYVGWGTVTTYTPATDTWRVVVPRADDGQYARPQGTATVWDGREVIVSDPISKPARVHAVDLATGSVRELPTPPITPTHLVWTGTDVLGLADDGSIAAWSPSTEAWTMGSPSPLGARTFSDAIGVVAWADDHLVVWGGTSPLDPSGTAPEPGPSVFLDGARYDPVTDTWTPIPEMDIAGRSGVPRHMWQRAVWADGRLVVVGTSPTGLDAIAWTPS